MCTLINNNCAPYRYFLRSSPPLQIRLIIRPCPYAELLITVHLIFLIVRTSETKKSTDHVELEQNQSVKT